MNKKYIIKNCPANYQNNCRSTKVHCYMCKDCTDCPLKQIVEKCNTAYFHYLCNNCDGVGYDEGCQDENCAFFILMQMRNFLEIEEVNE